MGAGRRLPCTRAVVQKWNGEMLSPNIRLFAIRILFKFMLQRVRTVSTLRCSTMVGFYYCESLVLTIELDLIPLQHVLNANRHSPTLIAYIWARCYAEFEDAREYFRSVAKQSLVSSDCGLWMRRSSGQLCAELVPSDVSWPYLDNYPDDVAFCSTPRVPMWDKANPGMVLESLTLDGYHSICSLLLRQIRHVFLPTSAMVTLGAVFHYSPSSQFDASVQIALIPDVRIHRSGWEDQRPLVQGQNGWSRYKSDRVSSNICLTAWDAGAQLWISQANHIFNSLQITSNLNNYVLIRRIEMGLHLVEPAPTRDPPPGFLFVCPERNLQVGPSSFRWPDSPAYWSLDPLGRERLGPQEAGRLGFPTIEPFIKIQGLFWDSGVYAGLHEFHQAQGFDPDSQEIARHLGHPIYQVSNELDILVARGLDGDYLGVDDAENLEASVVLDETTPVSWNLKCWMSAHLMLILFLTLSGLYKHVGGA
ncbi:hypothetical protein DFH09DRAFT_287323 [Mycena vulgaris]|nr:hypothetical protein DFH09DRAFT_287323 [Mycena vulgaris]